MLPDYFANFESRIAARNMKEKKKKMSGGSTPSGAKIFIAFRAATADCKSKHDTDDTSLFCDETRKRCTMAAAGCSTVLPRAAQLFAKKCFLVPSLGSSRCLSVGDVASIERTFTQADVEAFAAVTGDDNPIHLNPAFAQSRSFPACVVHGALING